MPPFAMLLQCLVGIEACNSSHQWTRDLTALGLHVKLMPAQYVKPHVKRGKNDVADSEAISEAVTRPTRHLVPVKSLEQQSLIMLHRVRSMLNRQCTQISNSSWDHSYNALRVRPIVASVLPIVPRYNSRPEAGS